MDRELLGQDWTVLKNGTLWRQYTKANPVESKTVDMFVLAVASGKNPTPPMVSTPTGNGLIGIVASGSIPDPIAPPPPSSAVVMQDLKGACIYRLGDALKARDTAGITHARTDTWVIDDTYVNGCKNAGIEILSVLAYAQGMSTRGDHYYPDDFVKWAQIQAARTQKYGFKAVEVWNEPWMTGFSQGGINAVEYMRLVSETAKAVWSVMPSTLVVVSLDYFTQQDPAGNRCWQDLVIAADTAGLLRDPRIRPSTHNYCQTAAPEDPRSAPGWAFDRYKLAYNALKAHGHPNPMVWVTEYGWDIPGGGENSPVSEPMQSDYTVRALRMMLASGIVERAYLYQAQADDFYGIWRRSDGSARPVCAAVKAL